MVNKKIILSTAAAALLAVSFVGCGSSDSTSNSTISGNAVKADLRGATVSAGGQSTTTDSTGAFSFSAPTGTSAVTITGGTYTLNGVDKNNSLTLEATSSQLSSGMEVSVLTTLIKKFSALSGTTEAQATQAACNLLGIDYTEGTTVLSNIDVADFESNALSVALTLEKLEAAGSTQLTNALTALKTAATSKLDTAQLATQLKTAASAQSVDINDTVDAISTGKPLGFALELAAGTKTANDYNSSLYLTSNVINLEGNSTSDVNGSSAAYYTLNSGLNPITRLNDTIDATGYMDDNNQTAISFKLKDYSADLTNANGNSSIFVKLTGLDAANRNNSYVMVLHSMDITNTSDILTFDFPQDGSAMVQTFASSDVAYKIGISDLNATALQNGNFISTNSGYNTVNIGTFKNYMDSLYSSEDSNVSTVGNFTTLMANGNFSLAVYVNIDDQNVTTDDRLTNIVGKDLSETASSGEKFIYDNVTSRGDKGYKVLDANLSY